MLILGVDTSGKNGSIALVRFAEEQAHTLEVVPLEGGTFSAQLVPQLSALLAKHTLTKNDIDGFAVASGPGSFTGLRVGLAAIKALAEVLQKPIAAVSLLETIAFELTLAANAKSTNLHVEYRCLVVLDAHRNEVFVGEYEISGDLAHLRSGPLPPPKLISEYLCTLDELVQMADKFARSRDIFTPDPNLVQNARSRMRDPFLCNLQSVSRPDASRIARLGWKKIQAGQIVTPEALDATYIRRSDAEIMRSTRDPK